MRVFVPSRRLVGGLMVLAVSAALAGCGSSGNRVSGKVTFDGKPVPAGTIYFTPDGSKGGTGVAGYAKIKDGVYDTAAAGGMPVITGPVTVAIEGQDPSAQLTDKDKGAKGETSEVTVKSLFPRWETKLDVTGTMTKDFEVPTDAAKAKGQGEKKVVQP